MKAASGSMLRRSASADRLAPPPAVVASRPSSPQPAAPATPPPTLPSHAARRHRLGLRFRGRRLGLSVPSEMWGAAALALRMTQVPAVAPRRALQRSASVIAQAFTTAAASGPPDSPVSEDQPKALAEALAWRPQLGAAEDAACLLLPAAACAGTCGVRPPSLRPAALAAPAAPSPRAACTRLTRLASPPSCTHARAPAGVYALTAPATVQPLYGAALALLYALLIALVRTWLLERRYAAVQRSEQELAAADSLFFQLGGAALHYKRRTPRQGGGGGGGGEDGGEAAAPPPLAVHCLHGFGASCYR